MSIHTHTKNKYEPLTPYKLGADWDSAADQLLDHCRTFNYGYPFSIWEITIKRIEKENNVKLFKSQEEALAVYHKCEAMF